MKKVMMALALTACTSAPAFAAEMTGYVSDDACATKSAKASKAVDWINVDAFEACVKKCVKEGSAMVFVTEDNKILRFDQASNAKAMPLMGHRVKVTGTAKDGILTVDTIAAMEMKK